MPNSVLLVLLAGLALGAQAPRSAPDPTAGGRSVAALADAYVDLALQSDPTDAALAGLPDPHPDRLPDRSPAALAREQAAEDGLSGGLARIDPDRVTPRERPTYAVLKELLDADRQARVCRAELWDVNQVAGWQLVLPKAAATQDISTPAAQAAWLKRWGSLPGFVDQEMANLRSGLAAGYSVPKPVVERVLAQLDGLTAAPPEASPFAAGLATADPAFKAKALAVVREAVTPALARYRDYLRSDYLPKARDTLGLSALPNGRACYRAMLRRYTTLDRSPEETFALGERTVAANKAGVVEIGRALFGVGDFAAIVAKTGSASQNRFTSREEALAFDQAALARTLDRSRAAFTELPTQPVVLQPMPDYLAEAGVPAHYEPQPDPAKPAAYAVPLATWKSWTRGEAEIAVFHETVPGHHLQVALARQIAPTTRLSKLADNAAYVEGWARYAEGLSEELGLYSTPYARITRRVWPARGLVLDPGLHMFGWTRDQARAYLKETGRFDDSAIEALIDRVAALPGQLTAYDTGGLEIQGLRRAAQDRLGSRFDLQAFHTAVIEEGVVPLGELRRHVEAWIAAQGR